MWKPAVPVSTRSSWKACAGSDGRVSLFFATILKFGKSAAANLRPILRDGPDGPPQDEVERKISVSQQIQPHPEEARSAVSKDGPQTPASFQIRLPAGRYPGRSAARKRPIPAPFPPPVTDKGLQPDQGIRFRPLNRSRQQSGEMRCRRAGAANILAPGSHWTGTEGGLRQIQL